MNPLTIIALLEAGLEIVERLSPIVGQLGTNGDITPEKQAALMARIDSLRGRTAGQFAGPEWDVSPPAPTPPANPPAPSIP